MSIDEGLEFGGGVDGDDIGVLGKSESGRGWWGKGCCGWVSQSGCCRRRCRFWRCVDGMRFTIAFENRWR